MRTTSEPVDDATRRRIRAEEAALLKRMQSDDIDAFEAFFLRYRTPIYRTAYGLTGDPQAAEEILQDTFARAYQRRHILRPDVSPLPWLHRVALNLCYSRLGRRRVPSEPMGEAVIGLIRDLATEPAEHAEQQELRRIVRDGVANLPPKHQSVVDPLLPARPVAPGDGRAARRPARDGEVAAPLRAALAAHPARGRSPLRRRLRRDRDARRGPGGGRPMMGRSTGCSTHRAALAAFAERSERGPEIAAAFDHLERCRRCEADLTETLLAVHAVRRAPRRGADRGSAPRRLGPPAPAGAATGRRRLASPLVAGRRRARCRARRGPDRADRGRLHARGHGSRAGTGRGRPPGADRARPDRRISVPESYPGRPPAQPTTVPEVVPPAYWLGPDGLGRVSAPVRVEIPPERAD